MATQALICEKQYSSWNLNACVISQKHQNQLILTLIQGQPAQHRPLPRHHDPPHPQTNSPFFPRLPAEVRLQIYGWLLGHRSLHYFNWWDESAQRWRTFQHGCTCFLNTILDGSCMYRRNPADLETWHASVEAFDAWMDLALMRTCRQAFTEALPQSLARADYTRVWRALAATFPHLRELRIGIYPRFGEDEGFDEAGRRLPSARIHRKQQLRRRQQTRSDSRQFVDDEDLPEFQDAWLEGMEWAVDRLSDLMVFQIALHMDIYHHLRARVKLFLAARQRQRQQQQQHGGSSPIQYRMWKAPDDRILSTRGDTRPLSAGSSVQGLDLRPNFWVGGKGKWMRQVGGKMTFPPDRSEPTVSESLIVERSVEWVERLSKKVPIANLDLLALSY
ncbi:hypothetical protein ASPACDRAFT_59393 [Aspergillus aculeatus ATCC 16872]|uniref:DUF7730 domain-containing protein n=1 Tax=Aspergillus aculeatus (strain ATCC 16872 / CBS 172.66 / WB 5094) TaxID=690307 RepID=A0A1L9WZP9_ASPA1|nr:uncharacterized protein ASPACDRAFT_59393 [Aspergillus aculeatus ATCC 16872]OJK01742.1 hypothetical protein ASPACDRAFT_59393 [Aspergillus aculeatus ATCC 16872]